MNAPSQNWGRFPSAWIEAGGFKKLKWKRHRTAGIAALRVYVGLAHRLRERDGIVWVNYATLTENVSLSRASVANGLDVLEAHKLVERGAAGKGSYKFVDYDPDGGWAKLPAHPLYDGNRFGPFKNWTMRSRTEFDALSLYLLIAARRDKNTNEAFLTYERIRETTKLRDERITAGFSLLAAERMLHTTSYERTNGPYGRIQSYRLAGIDPYRHHGTIGRAMTQEEIEALM